MSESYTFDPSIGDAVPTSSIGEVNNEVDYQHQADIYQKHNQSETAANLAARDDHSLEVGGSNNYAAESKLLAVQKELYDRNNGALPFDPIRQLELESLQDVLASNLVGGNPEGSTDTVEEPSRSDDWTTEDLMDDLQSELSQDPQTQEVFNWASNEFDNEIIESFNGMIASTKKPETVQRMLGTLKDLKKDPSSYTTGDPSEWSEISTQTIQWLSTEGSPELAKDIKTISDSVRAGVASKSEALKLVMNQPEMFKLMLKAAKASDVNFSLGL